MRELSKTLSELEKIPPEEYRAFRELFLAAAFFKSAFWEPVYPKLKEYFPQQLKDVGVEDFVRWINKAQPSLIRTEADELTYCLHVMIRYELEKELIDGCSGSSSFVVFTSLIRTAL